MKKSTMIRKCVMVAAFAFMTGFMKSQCAANFSFTNLSNGAVSFTASTAVSNTATLVYYWSWGNNVTFSATGISGQFPFYTYPTNGTYTVTLFIMTTSPSCSTAVQYTVGISNANSSPCNLGASFTRTNVANGQVNFTNWTTNTVSATTYTWNFGDGGTSNAQHPSHTYTNNGSYVVTLVASNNSSPACTATVQAASVINNLGCGISPSFVSSQAGNGVVNFSSTSTGTSSNSYYTWNFGDGSPVSHLVNPTHTYNNGSYNAVLSIANQSANAGCSFSVGATVSVTSNITCTGTAAFTSTQTGNGGVSFVSTSTGTTSSSYYTWNFGDGSPVSHVMNPTHTYVNGSYNAMLTVASSSNNAACTYTASASLSVTSNTCVANANFTLVPTSTAHHWNAYPTMSANIAAAQWSWGDGSTTNTLYTSHTYSATGTYTICLSLTLTCGSSATWCSLYYITRTSSAADNEVIEVNVVDPSQPVQPVDETGLAEASLASRMSVYPNPNAGMFTLKLERGNDGPVSIEVFDVVGQKAFSTIENPSNGAVSRQMDLTALRSGLYFVKVSAGTQSAVSRIAIEK